MMWFRTKHPQTRQIWDDLLLEQGVEEYLSDLRSIDHQVLEHSLRVSLLCLDLGIELGVGEPALQHLGMAGLLHDIGKTRLPRELLAKAECLDWDEFQMVQGHVRLGFIALKGFEPVIVREVMAAHHEFSQRPYPRNGMERRRRARKSPDRRQTKPVVRELAQILAVADMADALAEDRAYKGGFSRNQIEVVLREEFCGEPVLVDQVLVRMDGHNGDR